MKSIKCHVCCHVNEVLDEQSPFCVRCGADLIDLQAETKCIESSAASYATSNGRFAVQTPAFAYLTDKRLILIPAKLTGFGLTGVLTSAIMNKMTSESGVISIQFEHVKAVKEGKFGLFVKAIIVETAGGEMVKMTVPNRNKWKEAITRTLHG